MAGNMSALYEEIIKSLVKATDDALLEVEAAAKQKAPQRRIFKAPGRRRTLAPEDIGVRVGGTQRRGLLGVLNTSRGAAFKWPEKQGRLVFDLGGDVSRVRGTRARMISSATKTEAGEVFKGAQDIQIGGSVRGRPNSRRQVINTKELGKIGGDLNTLSEPGQLSHELITGFRHGNPGRVNLNKYVTSRGAFEVRTGRAVTVNAQGQEQIGGRLVEGIKSTGAQRHGPQIYGYVEAYAADPGRTFNYAWAQEMGTGHNRPQPFLRPALREQHDRIMSNNRNALREAFEGFARRPAGRVVTGKLVVHYKSGATGLTGLTPVVQYLTKMERDGVQ